MPSAPILNTMTIEQIRAAARGFREAARAPVGKATAQSFIRLAKRYEDVADEREATDARSAGGVTKTSDAGVLL